MLRKPTISIQHCILITSFSTEFERKLSEPLFFEYITKRLDEECEKNVEFKYSKTFFDFFINFFVLFGIIDYICLIYFFLIAFDLYLLFCS